MAQQFHSQLSMYLNEMSTHVHQGRYQTRMFTEALLKIAPNWKRPKCPSAKTRHKHCGEATRWNTTLQLEKKKAQTRNFAGGPVVKNLPSNTGDTGLIPGQGTKIPPAVG